MHTDTRHAQLTVWSAWRTLKGTLEWSGFEGCSAHIFGQNTQQWEVLILKPGANLQSPIQGQVGLRTIQFLPMMQEFVSTSLISTNALVKIECA